MSSLGWALAGLGQLDEGIREMREGIAAIAETGADMGMAYYLCALARACGERGEASEGLALLEQAFDTLAKSNSTYQLPELLRTKGELLSRLDPADEAAEELVPAIAGRGPRAGCEIVRAEGRASPRTTLCRPRTRRTRHETFLRPSMRGSARVSTRPI